MILAAYLTLHSSNLPIQKTSVQVIPQSLCNILQQGSCYLHVFLEYTCTANLKTGIKSMKQTHENKTAQCTATSVHNGANKGLFQPQ